MIDLIHQEEGDWSVPLKPDTPGYVLRDIDVRTYAYSTMFVTPLWVRPGDVSLADLKGLARYAGVYMAQTDGLLTLEGPGLIWWLGQENDGGDISVTDTTSAALDLEGMLDARVFAFSNGLTKGDVNATATTRQIKQEAGTTRRQYLDSICALFTQDYEWRVNPDGTIDVDTQATLFPTSTDPETILTEEGGREGGISGLRAELELSGVDFEDYRTQVHMDWDDAVSTQSATNTPLATWNDFAGADPDIETLIDWRPRKAFREKPNKPDRINASAYAAWTVNSTAQALRVATRHANQTNTYAVDLTARIDEYDPFRFCKPGDTLYAYDLDLNLTDTSNQVYYRGEAIHPKTLRLQGMSTPILDGYGVYLNRGNTGDIYDLTPYVEFEQDDTVLDLGTRKRFRARRARPSRFNRRAVYRAARQRYLLQQYLSRQ